MKKAFLKLARIFIRAIESSTINARIDIRASGDSEAKETIWAVRRAISQVSHVV